MKVLSWFRRARRLNFKNQQKKIDHHNNYNTNPFAYDSRFSVSSLFVNSYNMSHHHHPQEKVQLHVPIGRSCSGSSSTYDGVEQMMMIEHSTVTNYQPPNAASYSSTTSSNIVPKKKRIDYVYNPSDGSVLLDHKGRPVSVDKLLATKPLRGELSTRPGPGNKKLTYISGEGVSRTLNDIFGFDGWNLDIIKVQREECVLQPQQRDSKYHIVYTAQVRLTHKASGTYKEDCGVGDAADKVMATAISHALKGSITDAMKRAARHFGDKLGNSLYQGNFSINKAPTTLQDALDKYDIERANTKFGFPKDNKNKTDQQFSYPNNNKVITNKENKQISLLSNSSNNHHQNSTITSTKQPAHANGDSTTDTCTNTSLSSSNNHIQTKAITSRATTAAATLSKTNYTSQHHTAAVTSTTDIQQQSNNNNCKTTAGHQSSSSSSSLCNSVQLSNIATSNSNNICNNKAHRQHHHGHDNFTSNSSNYNPPPTANDALKNSILFSSSSPSSSSLLSSSSSLQQQRQLPSSSSLSSRSKLRLGQTPIGTTFNNNNLVTPTTTTFHMDCW